MACASTLKPSFLHIQAEVTHPMTDGSRRRSGLPRTRGTGAIIILMMAVIMLGACTTPRQVPASASEQASSDSRQRSSKSSGIANQENAVSITRIVPPMLGLAGVHRIGSAQANIGIVEFSDYQCPYCRGFHDQVFPRLKKEYVDTGIVQFIHRRCPPRWRPVVPVYSNASGRCTMRCMRIPDG